MAPRDRRDRRAGAELADEVGEIMEKPVIDHHQDKTGERFTERGVFVPHPSRELVSATLDAYREFDDTVIDAKVCNNFQTLDDIIEFYSPQIVVQMSCRGAARGALLIMHGLAETREYPVSFNEAYEGELCAEAEVRAAGATAIEILPRPQCPGAVR